MWLMKYKFPVRQRYYGKLIAYFARLTPVIVFVLLYTILSQCRIIEDVGCLQMTLMSFPLYTAANVIFLNI